MENFIDYQKFPDRESAIEMAVVLEENGIPYQMDDSALRFKLVASNYPFMNMVIIRIREEDVEKANSLFLEAEQAHFLYSFSDEDIIDVIANPDEWTRAEQLLALQIAKQRGLNITAGEIRTARKPDKEEKLQEEPDEKSLVPDAASLFLYIGIASVAQVIVVNQFNVELMFGLGMPRLINVLLKPYIGMIEHSAMLIDLLFSGIFILLWYYAGLGKKGAYIAGIAFYLVDALLCFTTQYGEGALSHFALLFCFSPLLKRLFEVWSSKEKDKTEGSHYQK